MNILDEINYIKSIQLKLDRARDKAISECSDPLEKDSLARGHGIYTGSCGHLIKQCRCVRKHNPITVDAPCSECKKVSIFESFQYSENDIRQAIHAGHTENLKAKVLMRDVGATEGIIEINGVTFVINDTSWLKYAGINTDYSTRVTSQYYPGLKNGQDLIERLRHLPRLTLADFKDVIRKKLYPELSQPQPLPPDPADPFEQGSKA
jgi:hypothetical protein